MPKLIEAPSVIRAAGGSSKPVAYDGAVDEHRSAGCPLSPVPCPLSHVPCPLSPARREAEGHARIRST